MIRNPDLVDIISAHRLSGGRPGVDAFRTLTRQAIEAFAVIDDALATRRNEARDE